MAVGKLSNISQINPAANGDLFMVERGGQQYAILYENLPFSGAGGGGSGLAYAITGISVTGGETLTGLFNLYPLGGVRIITSGDKVFISGAGIDSSNVVYTTGDQSIDGIKTFLTRSQFYSGAEIFFNSGNSPGVRISGMFNGTGQRYTGLFIDIFDSGKVSGSMLAEFRINGETRASISNSGLATFSGVFSTGPFVMKSPHSMLQEYGQYGIRLIPDWGNSAFGVSRNDTPTATYCSFGYYGGTRIGFSLVSNGGYYWTESSTSASMATVGTVIGRDSSGILAIRGANPFTSAALRIYQVTGGGSGEFALFGWQNSGLVIGPFAFNSGILRDVKFTGANLWFVPTGTTNFNSRPFANGSGVAFTGELLGYATITNLQLTGQALYEYYTGLSGALSQTGVSLINLIQSTGNQAWNAANDNGINLSGNLASTGATLESRITGFSGYAYETYYPRTNLSGYLDSLSGLSTGYVTGVSGTLSQSIFQTGSNLQGQINTINSRPYVTGISVTGAPTLTGLVKFVQGAGTVSIKQSGDSVMVSGGGMGGAVSNTYYAQSNGTVFSNGDIFESNTPNSFRYGTVVDNDLIARNIAVTADSLHLNSLGINQVGTNAGKIYVYSNHTNPLERQFVFQTGFNGYINDGRQIFVHFTGTGAAMISKTGANMDLKYDWVPRSGEIIAFRLTYPELRWKEQWRNPDTGYAIANSNLITSPLVTGLGTSTYFSVFTSNGSGIRDSSLFELSSTQLYSESEFIAPTSRRTLQYTLPTTGHTNLLLSPLADSYELSCQTLGTGNTSFDLTAGAGATNGEQKFIFFVTGECRLPKTGARHSLIDDWIPSSGHAIKLCYLLGQWREEYRVPPISGGSGLVGGQVINDKLVTGSGTTGYFSIFTSNGSGIRNSLMTQYDAPSAFNNKIITYCEHVSPITRATGSYRASPTGAYLFLFSKDTDAWVLSANTAGTGNTIIRISSDTNTRNGEQKFIFWNTGEAYMPVTGDSYVLTQDWVPSSGYMLKLTYFNDKWREEYRWPPITGVGGVGGGEANTASNLGNGIGLFSSKVGVDLPFYSISGGTGIEIKRIGNEIRVDSTVNTGLFYLASNPNGYLDTLSGLSTGYVTGVSGTLRSSIEQTGQLAWNAANDNGINLSGNLTATGANLQAQINTISAGSYVTGISVTGGNSITGLISYLGAGSTEVIQNGDSTISFSSPANVITGSGRYNYIPIFLTGQSGIVPSAMFQNSVGIYEIGKVIQPYYVALGVQSSTTTPPTTNFAPARGLGILSSRNSGHYTGHIINVLGAVTGQNVMILWNTGNAYLEKSPTMLLQEDWVPRSGDLIDLVYDGSRWHERYRWPIRMYQQDTGFVDNAFIYANFTGKATQIVNMTGYSSFTLTGLAYDSEKEIKLLLNTTGMVPTISYPTGWIWIGQRPTGVSTGSKHAVLSLISTSNFDEGVWAAWNTEP
jgi:hypothetical protein